MSIEKKYVCTFCKKQFARETWYKKHVCDKKRRFLEKNNIYTMKAHRLFNHWQRRNGFLRRGREKTMEEFCTSPFFNDFKSLVEFSAEENLVSSFAYLNWLIDERIAAPRWKANETVERFLESQQEIEHPTEHARQTFKHIRAWCEGKQYNSIDDFFSRVPSGTVLNMVRENKLSPWVLLAYEPCLETVIERMETADLYRLDEIINITHWFDKIEGDKMGVDKMQEYCETEIIRGL